MNFSYFFVIPSFQNLLRAIENIGIVSVYGIRYLTTGNVTQQNYIKYVMMIIWILWMIWMIIIMIND